MMSAALATVSIFGHRLRHWRRARGLSQINLAEHAGVSVRHVGFLETGRSKPSRFMIATLGMALDLDVEETAALYVAAGFVPPPAPQRSTRPVDLTQAIDLVLTQQEPFPALALDPRWDIQRRNTGADRLFAPFRAAYDMPVDLAGNAIHVFFHPKGMKPFVEDWSTFARSLLDVLHGEAMAGSRAAANLLVEIARYPAPAASRGDRAVPVLRLAKGDQRMTFFTTLSRFAMPVSPASGAVTIECFHPADDATVRLCRRLARDAKEMST